MCSYVNRLHTREGIRFHVINRKPDPSPAELLESSPVHGIAAVATILQLLSRNGEPNRRAVHELIRSGRLRLVDPEQPIQRWTVSRAELERYIEGGAS